jgi:import inner membrane translocase subunit TIM50
VKDLSKLNRDLRHVVIVDDDPDAFQFQPENGIRIKPFVDPKDKGDRSLDKLRKFLMAVVMEGVADDIPAVLRQFRGLDADALGDAYEKRLREAKIREAEKHMKGLGGLLRKQKAFQGVANPFAGTAAGGELAPQPAKGLSAKDIVGGAPAEQQQGAGAARAAAAPGELPPELQHQQSAPPPAGPVKKGKLWEKYQNYWKEAEEDQRRKLELWQRKQAQREEEARRAALQQQAAAGGR